MACKGIDGVSRTHKPLAVKHQAAGSKPRMRGWRAHVAVHPNRRRERARACFRKKKIKKYSDRMGLWGLGAMFFYLGGLDFGNREANCKLARRKKDGPSVREEWGLGRSDEVEEKGMPSTKTRLDVRRSSHQRPAP